MKISEIFSKKNEPVFQPEAEVSAPAVDGFSVLSERIGKEEVQKAQQILQHDGLYRILGQRVKNLSEARRKNTNRAFRTCSLHGAG